MITSIPTGLGYAGVGYGASHIPQAIENAVSWYDFLIPRSFDDASAIIAMIASVGLAIRTVIDFNERRKDKKFEREKERALFELELAERKANINRENKNDPTA